MTSTIKSFLLGSLMGASFSAFAFGAEYKTEKTALPLLVPHMKFSQDCGQCHVAKRWDVINPDFHFDHAKVTGYSLNGAHAGAKCTQCHNDRGPVKMYSVRGCAGCHPDPHRAGLGPECSRCHSETTWRPKNSLGEHAQTAFPLTGAHLATECQKCHLRASVGDFKGVSILCYGCHQADFQKGPRHIQFNYPRLCGDCHTTSSFAPARFNHNFLSNVSDCYTCHQVDYQRAPNHISFNYPHTCGDCHNTTSFTGARFNHNFLSGTADCYACHAADYQRAANHVGVRATTCFDCHVTTTWLLTPIAPAPRPR